MKYAKIKWDIEYNNSDNNSGGQWYNVGPAIIKFSYNMNKEDEEEVKANAILISKAPEMYEAIDLFINGKKSLYDQSNATEKMKSLLKEIKNESRT